MKPTIQKYRVIKVPTLLEGVPQKVGDEFYRSPKDAITQAFLRFGQIQAIGEPEEVQAAPENKEPGEAPDGSSQPASPPDEKKIGSVRSELQKKSRAQLLLIVDGLRKEGKTVNISPTANAPQMIDAILKATGYSVAQAAPSSEE